MKLRLSPQTLQVLDAFLHSPTGWKYGHDISRDTGLKSGTLYPVLMRLAERRLLETSWERLRLASLLGICTGLPRTVCDLRGSTGQGVRPVWCAQRLTE